MTRTPIEDPTLPNLTSRRPESRWTGKGLFWYARASDGAVIVGTLYSGVAVGFAATGRRYESLDAAAAAVRAARRLVADQWAAKGWAYTFAN